MKILLVLGHPDPASFNAGLARALNDALREAGHDVIFHDLCAEGFPAAIPPAEFPKNAELEHYLKIHCQELAFAEGIVIVHPNWWGMPPAVLKGWVDRVFRPGVAYEFLEGDDGEGVPKGLLKARVAVVFNTGNTPPQREREVFGDPLERLWRDCIFDLCGVKEFHRRLFGMVVTSSPEQREAWIKEAVDLAREVFG